MVIGQNVTAIEGKADQAITFDLHELTLKMKEVEETKKIDEDYGLGVSVIVFCRVVLCCVVLSCVLLRCCVVVRAVRTM